MAIDTSTRITNRGIPVEGSQGPRGNSPAARDVACCGTSCGTSLAAAAMPSEAELNNVQQLLTTLSTGEARSAEPRRLAAAASLHAIFTDGANRNFCCAQFPQLLNGLEASLLDQREPVRREAHILVGALGASLGPDIRPFCLWLVRSAGTRASGWSLLVVALNECLEQLQRAGSSIGAMPHVAGVLPCVRSMLERVDEPSLLSSLLPLLLTLNAREYAPAVLPHFAGIVDALLGWSLDPSAQESSACEPVNATLCQLGELWGGSEVFGQGLLNNLITDMEAFRPEPLAARLHGAPSAISLRRLSRFAACAAAVAGGLGRRYGVLPDQPALSARFLACLELHLPNAVAAIEVGGSDENVLAVATRFLETARDSVLSLATSLRQGFTPHHAAASRLLLGQLGRGARISSVLRVLRCHMALLELQGSALLPHSALALLATDAPTSVSAAHTPEVGLERRPEGGASIVGAGTGCRPLAELRLHNEPAVLAAVLATHRYLLLGPNTSSAAASVLLQGMLAETRHLLGRLQQTQTQTSAPPAVSPASSDDTSAERSGTSPLPVPRVGALSDGGGEGGRDGGGDGCGERGGEGGDVVTCRLLHLQLALFTEVTAHTTHCSHLLSIAGTLLRYAHPLRSAAVLARPALAHPVLLSLLAAVRNSALTLPPPPGTGKPVHASLSALATQLRVLLVAQLLPTRGPAAQLAALQATAAALSAAAPAAAVMSTGEGAPSRPSGGGDTSCFDQWLGLELGAGTGSKSDSRLALLVRRALPLTLSPNEAIRGEALNLLSAVLRCPAAAALGAASLSRIISAAIAQVSMAAPDAPCSARCGCQRSGRSLTANTGRRCAAPPDPLCRSLTDGSPASLCSAARWAATICGLCCRGAAPARACSPCRAGRHQPARPRRAAMGAGTSGHGGRGSHFSLAEWGP